MLSSWVSAPAALELLKYLRGENGPGWVRSSRTVPAAAASQTATHLPLQGKAHFMHLLQMGHSEITLGSSSTQLNCSCKEQPLRRQQVSSMRSETSHPAYEKPQWVCTALQEETIGADCTNSRFWESRLERRKADSSGEEWTLSRFPEKARTEFMNLFANWTTTLSYLQSGIYVFFLKLHFRETIN